MSAWLRRALSALVALAIGLVLVDGAARVALLWVGVRKSDAQNLENHDEARKKNLRAARFARLAPSYTLHPYVGFVDAPATGANGDLRDLGFSGPLVRERDPERFVVGVFGGSVAAMFAAHDGPARAFHGLAAGREIAVANVALGGYKQPQPLLALAYLLALGVHLDAVLLVDGFNDVTLAPTENVPRGVSPLYPRAWSELLADLDAQPRARRRLAEIGVLGDWREALTAWEESRIGVAALGSRLAGRAIDARIIEQRGALAQERVAETSSYQVTGPRWAPESDDQLYAMLASLWRDSSLQMARLCAANGIRFVHVLQPNQYGGRKPMGEEERGIGFHPRQPYAEPARRGYPLLRERGRELAAQGVAFHDFADLFADVEEPLYIDDCCHFGARGNEILADAIAAVVK